VKILIAILSCQLFKDNGNNQALYDTWIPQVKGADYKIFIGQGSTKTREDEVIVDAQDDYLHVTYKAKAMYQWAHTQGYEYIFKCFPDTYVCPSRLLTSGFEKYDYSGNFVCKPITGDYCCGGTGCWFSSRAYEELIKAEIPTEDTILQLGRSLRFGRGPKRPKPTPSQIVIKNIDTWAEDKWSGDIVRKHKNFTTHHDTRYEDNIAACGPELGNLKITQHLSRPLGEGVHSHYEKEWMYAKHAAWVDSLKGLETINKVAVITPTILSRSTLLFECKRSVAAQSWSGEIYHAVGIDDKQEGAAVTRNKIVQGLDSSYEWIAFCDDDDMLLPEHLSVLVSASSGVDIVYSDCQEEGFTKTWQTRPFDYESVRASNYIPVTVLMRRSMFEKVGGFKSEPYPGEDQSLWLRAALSGAKFRYVPQVTWTYRQHPQHRTYQSS